MKPAIGRGRPKRYTTADGERVPSVTELLGYCKNWQPLLAWNFKRGLEPALAHLQAQNEPPQQLEYADLKPCWRMRYETRDEAADIGSLVPAMIERHYAGEDIQNLLFDQPAEVALRASRAFANFLDWYTGQSLTAVELERPLVSENLKFAGTFDMLARHARGHLTLIDWKSSKGLYAEVPIQLAAYRLLLQEHGSDVQDAHALRISKSGTNWEQQWYGGELLDAAEKVFLQCVRMHHAMAAMSKVAG